MKESDVNNNFLDILDKLLDEASFESGKDRLIPVLEPKGDDKHLATRYCHPKAGGVMISLSRYCYIRQEVLHFFVNITGCLGRITIPVNGSSIDTGFIADDSYTISDLANSIVFAVKKLLTEYDNSTGIQYRKGSNVPFITHMKSLQFVVQYINRKYNGVDCKFIRDDNVAFKFKNARLKYRLYFKNGLWYLTEYTNLLGGFGKRRYATPDQEVGPLIHMLRGAIYKEHSTHNGFRDYKRVSHLTM